MYDSCVISSTHHPRKVWHIEVGIQVQLLQDLRVELGAASCVAPVVDGLPISPPHWDQRLWVCKSLPTWGVPRRQPDEGANCTHTDGHTLRFACHQMSCGQTCTPRRSRRQGPRFAAPCIWRPVASDASETCADQSHVETANVV